MIGIAMTTYNGEKYLKEQIDSILNQTVSDFELIVCDDVSSDSTMDILNDYAEKDDRVHVFRNEENLGFLKNFEKAIRICLDRGAEYVALSDQDDVWTDDYLMVLSNILKVNPDIDIAYGKRLNFTSTPPPPPCTIINNHLDCSSPLKRLQIALYRNGLFTGATMLIRNRFFGSALPLNKEFKFHDIWFVLLSEALQKAKGTNVIITYRRRHSDNVSGNTPLKKKLYLFLCRKELSNRYFLISETLNRVGNLIAEDLKKELNSAKLYYHYKRFFLFRFFYFPFFIKRYSVFTWKMNPLYVILRYIIYG